MRTITNRFDENQRGWLLAFWLAVGLLLALWLSISPVQAGDSRTTHEDQNVLDKGAPLTPGFDPLLEANYAPDQPAIPSAASSILLTEEWLSGDEEKTTSVAWGDMDGDGDLDLALGNRDQVNRLYHNDGFGIFTEIPNALGSATDNTTSAAWGDMDGDGDLDLAVGIDGEANRLYRNDGGEGFTELPAALGTTTDYTNSLAWGDMDGDGDLDLAIGNSSYWDSGCLCYKGGGGRLFRNDGGGAFSEMSGILGSASDDTRGVAWADADGDGDLDLAVGNFNQTNCIYLNLGNITFTPRCVAAPVETTTSIAWGDVDSDGDLDLGAGNFAQMNQYYRNDGGGTFSVHNLGNTTYATQSIAWGDIDGDGDLDLAEGNSGSNHLYSNDGDSVFTEIPVALGDITDDTNSIAFGDMDGDGDLDLVVGNEFAINHLYRNDSGISFSEIPNAMGDGADLTLSVAWGDIDGDGDLDLVTGNEDQVNRVYRDDGGGDLNEIPSALGGAADWTRSVAWGDLDGDNDLDLAVGNLGVNRLFRNMGGGVFSELPSPLGSASEANMSLAWGDMDGDGDLDIAVGVDGEANRLYRNDAGGGFTELPGALGTTPDYPNSLAWGDVDGDSDLDLAVGNNGVNRLYRNDGGGVFSEISGALGVAANTTKSIAWGDMDGDGDLDLAVGNIGVNRIYRNDGGTTFNEIPGSLGSAANWTQSIAWGDMDGDGDLDLAVGNELDTDLLYRNEGGGVFTEILDSLGSTAGATYSLAWGDVDGDGDPDLTTGSYGGINRLFRNPRQGPTAALPDNAPYIVLSQPGNMPAADFYAISGSLTGQHIPFTYTVFDPEGDPAGLVRAWYSLDGGGQWFTATATSSQHNIPSGIWDAFDPVVGTQWRSLSGADATNAICGGAQGNGLNFNGGSLRSATTRPLDLSTGGKLQFALRIGAGPAPCDEAESGEDVILEYTTNGGNWTPIATYDTGDYPIFTPISLAIPVEAHSPATSFRWRQLRHSGTGFDNWALDNVRVEIPNTFVWDTFASNFFGQSKNVVLRLVAYPQPPSPANPGAYQYINHTAGPFTYAPTSAATYAFPAIGSTQVQVLDSNGQPASGATVYRIPDGQSTGGPISSIDGTPYHTNSLGYLLGHGTISLNDTLIALLPVETTDRYTLYHTNATPTATGLSAHTVSSPGLQTLQISSTHPLLLFNLDLSLEWDARNDGTFLSDLENAIRNASSVLYDVSDGQVALGQVHLHQDRQDWTASDVVMYAQSGIRPRASMGGMVDVLTDDLYLDGKVIPNAYIPGQVHMGPNWDPFGANLTELTPDWQRALAHELSHYLLFLPDNYLGLDDDGDLSYVDCQGSFMTNTYDDDYSEFLTASGWSGDCQNTIAAHTTGRTDWETVTRFYQALLQPSAQNTGPSLLPLLVTQLEYDDPDWDPETLSPRIFDVRHADSNVLLSAPRAQGFLYQNQDTPDLTDDQVIALGPTVGGGDRLKVRGAEAGDRLCLFGPPDPFSGQAFLGCRQPLDALDASIPVSPLTDWEPNILVRSVTSTTLQISVTLSSPVNTLNVQFFPSYGGPGETIVSPWASMSTEGSALIYHQQLSLAAPAFEGWVRVWVPGADPIQEALSQVFLSPPWGPASRGSGYSGDKRAWGANQRLLGAPVASGDGQVSVFNLKDIFADTGTVSLQALNSPPDMPAWLTPVGQGYRFIADQDLSRSIVFDYLQREVPPGYEHTLTVYYSPDEGSSWLHLDTELDDYMNQASAHMPHNAVLGQGIYLLAATVEMPALTQGWNLFSYPLPGTRPVSQALVSIEGSYTSVYEPTGGEWSLYDATVVTKHPEFTPLVNDLAQFSFGHSYWIYATGPVIPYLGVPGTLSPLEINISPATYYGYLEATSEFTPTLGMSIQAWVGDKLCGQGTVTDLDGKMAYKLQVAADSGDGCGQLGRVVIFTSSDQNVRFGTTSWDNCQAWFYPLPAKENRLHLPIIAH